MDMELSDTSRLDWILMHMNANFDRDTTGHSMVTYLVSGEKHAKGVAGRFIVRAETQRQCIDKFIAGDIQRID